MKNLISFIILLIFGAFVFFIGWTQIKVKPGTIGIVQSKTGGVDSKPVIPGEFSWHKEFLLPTNAQINVFEYKPYNGKKTVTGNRFQGDYSFTFQISLSYQPELIVNLLQQNQISSQEDFEAYLDGIAAYLAQRASDYCLGKYSKNADFSPSGITISELTTGIAFYKEYPDFDINVLSITDYKLPGDNLSL